MTFHEARALLGVPPGAPPRDVKFAYRRAARATHPDGGGDARRFDEVRAAYLLLTRAPSVRFVRTTPWWRAALRRPRPDVRARARRVS